MESVYIILIVVGAVLLCIAIALYRHQSLLKDRARLMRDAMRHRDFSFRLPTKGLLFGEKALQETLNDMGHDIEKLVARNEVESWERLTRVLTHEIMNVMAPIKSISQTYLADPDIKDTPYEEGIKAIHDASQGLSAFVESYRKMTQLQEPVMKVISLSELVNEISSMFPELHWSLDMPHQVKIHADESLLRQVFINMAKNAIEADAHNLLIIYSESNLSNSTLQSSSQVSSQAHSFPPAFRHSSDPISSSSSASGLSYSSAPAFTGRLFISNDGHVIPDDVAREIFIPFFTTKPHGSGIGLSLSRKILMLHGLLLSLSPTPLPGSNTTFILEPLR